MKSEFLFLSSLLSSGGSHSQGETVVRESKTSIACRRGIKQCCRTHDGLTESVRVGHGGGDVLGGSRNQNVVTVLGLLQSDQLGVSRSVGLHWLEPGGLVGEGLLGHGGDGLDGVGGVGVAGVNQLGGAVGRNSQDGENNLRERLEERGQGAGSYQELHVGELRVN